MRFNTDVDLAKFFAKDSRMVSINEFYKFWDSLTPEEIMFFRTAPLD